MKHRPEFLERCQALKEAAQLSLNEIEGFEELSERVLTQVVLSAIKAYQQKVAVGIEDSASDLLETFKQNVTKQIFQNASGWIAVQKEYFLYPKGCRFCFQKGDKTIVVVEEDPGVRTLNFMIGMQDSQDDIQRSSLSERVSLSVPYTVFVFSFKQNKLEELRCYWRSSPLEKITDGLSVCLLPNIHVGGRVCLGTGLIHGNTSEVCKTVLNHFWSSQFNSDLSTEWWNKHRLSPKLATGRIWQENSAREPLFIFNVPFTPFKSLKEVIDQIVANSEEPSESNFRHKLTSEIDSCVEQLFHKITNYFKKTKFEKHSPKDVTDSLKDHLRTSVEGIVEIVMVLNHEINKFSSEANADNRTVKPVGYLWNQEKS